MNENTSEQIERAIQSLLLENKTPSIALIKHRLPNPVPMAKLINEFNKWKQTRQLPKIEKINSSSDQTRIEALENQVQILNEKIARLEKN